MDEDCDSEVPNLLEHNDLLQLDNTHVRVPLTIICGFLGAGKSTLLKRILTERHGYRIAVIVNEFGDTADIESRTINVSSPNDPTADQSEEILELANGCLCCSIKDTGVAAIEKLMQRKGAFDHILLETTGLADPGPIASIFWHNEEFATGLGRGISLDGVICVVDAVFGKQQMEEDHSTDPDSIGESLRQIAGSDVILLNKIDLVTPETLARTEELILRVNPAASVHKTIKANVDLKLIMDISAFTSPPQLQTTNLTADHGHTNCQDPDHTQIHSSKEPTHYELRGISSLQVSCPLLDKVRFEKLDEWIRGVLWENRIPGGSEVVQVLRCKGLLTMESGEQYVLQGVRSMYEIERLGEKDDIGVSQGGKLVLIGKGLDDSVRQSLEDAMQ